LDLAGGQREYNNNLEVTQYDVERQHQLAYSFALGLSQDPKSVMALTGCDPNSRVAQDCRGQFLERFLPQVFRRPATPEELTEMELVFTNGEQLGGDFQSGVRAVVEVALQSPELLYLVELGDRTLPSPPGLVALTSYETAARLSFFLAGSPPDAELISVAAQAGLRAASQVEAQARRLLSEPEAREVVRQFYARLMNLSDVGAPGLQRNQPTHTLEILQLSLKETEHFIDDVTFGVQGTFRALLTEPTTWVNGPLAAFYGLPGVTGDAFQKVQLDPSRRAGILTHSSFLTASSHGSETNPVTRGTWVLRNLLCVAPEPPPLQVLVPPPVVLGPNATARAFATAWIDVWNEHEVWLRDRSVVVVRGQPACR